MKKIIGILAVCMMLCSVNVSAMNFTEMTEKLVKHYDVKVTDDVSGISKLQNRRNIKNPSLISAAINSGIIVARNGLVNENGTDFTPLTDGIIKRYIKDEKYKFVSGLKADLLRNQGVIFNKNTFFVTENSKESDLSYTDIYTCVVDKSNNALFVWKAGKVVKPAIYKVKLYWLEEDEMIVTDIYRKEFDLWIKESKNQFYSLDSSQIGLSQDFIMKNLDQYIYIFADSYGENIKIWGVSQ